MHNFNLNLKSLNETQAERIQNLEQDVRKLRDQSIEQSKEIVQLKQIKNQNSSSLAEQKIMYDNIKRETEDMKKKVRDATEELHRYEMISAQK